MFALPASTPERLDRAESLVSQAAQAGAQLVVLPELFNTGYEYSAANYHRAELQTGLTSTWLISTAASLGIHLAGSFLLREKKDIFNTLLLIAPDGRTWRYDKRFPFMWERAYFRPGRGVTVAHTELGKIGMLICWDVAHPRLWRSYAGQVDLMLVSSCPPKIHDAALRLPDGSWIELAAINPLIRRIQVTAAETFGDLLRCQAGYLGVPLASAAVTGRFETALPRPRLSLLGSLLARPGLWKHLLRAEQARIQAGYFNETYISAASGEVLQRVPQGEEGFALACVELPDSPPCPASTQPRFGISPWAYLLDRFANAALISTYRSHRVQVDHSP
jgi:predicted amidohydrolase